MSYYNQFICLKYCQYCFKHYSINQMDRTTEEISLWESYRQIYMIVQHCRRGIQMTWHYDFDCTFTKIKKTVGNELFSDDNC